MHVCMPALTPVHVHPLVWWCGGVDSDGTAVGEGAGGLRGTGIGQGPLQSQKVCTNISYIKTAVPSTVHTFREGKNPVPCTSMHRGCSCRFVSTIPNPCHGGATAMMEYILRIKQCACSFDSLMSCFPTYVPIPNRVCTVYTISTSTSARPVTDFARQVYTDPAINVEFQLLTAQLAEM